MDKNTRIDIKEIIRRGNVTRFTKWGYCVSSSQKIYYKGYFSQLTLSELNNNLAESPDGYLSLEEVLSFFKNILEGNERLLLLNTENKDLVMTKEEKKETPPMDKNTRINIKAIIRRNNVPDFKKRGYCVDCTGRIYFTIESGDLILSHLNKPIENSPDGYLTLKEIEDFFEGKINEHTLLLHSDNKSLVVTKEEKKEEKTEEKEDFVVEPVFIIKHKGKPVGFPHATEAEAKTFIKGLKQQDRLNKLAQKTGLNPKTIKKVLDANEELK